MCAPLLAAGRCETRIWRENQRQFASSQPFWQFARSHSSPLISFKRIRDVEASRRGGASRALRTGDLEEGALARAGARVGDRGVSVPATLFPATLIVGFWKAQPVALTQGSSDGATQGTPIMSCSERTCWGRWRGPPRGLCRAQKRLLIFLCSLHFPLWKITPAPPTSLRSPFAMR